MLRLTKKADYGLMALKYLAEQSDGSAHSAKDIAEAYHIPPQLLAKILQTLAKAGLLRRERQWYMSMSSTIHTPHVSAIR